jgi:hypothetical protein
MAHLLCQIANITIHQPVRQRQHLADFETNGFDRLEAEGPCGGNMLDLVYLRNHEDLRDGVLARDPPDSGRPKPTC